MSVIWWIVRIICYAALAMVIIGSISLFVPFALDLCSNQSGGTVKCTAPFYRGVFEFGFVTVMMSVFTGIPTLLALGGIGFLIKDVFWRKR